MNTQEPVRKPAVNKSQASGTAKNTVNKPASGAHKDAAKTTKSAAKPAAGAAKNSVARAAGASASRNANAAKRASAAKRAELKRRRRNQKIIRISLAALCVVLAGALIAWAVLTSKDNGDPVGAGSVAAENTGASSQTASYSNGTENTPFEGSDDKGDGANTDTSYEASDNSGEIAVNLSVTPEPVPTPEPTATPEPTPSPEPTPTPVPTPTPKPVKLDHTYEIEVDKSKQVVTVYTVGEEGYYDLIVKQFICSTGNSDKIVDGWYKIGTQNRWKQMNNGSYAQYASNISGPFWFHSGCYYSASISQLKVRYYNNLGQNVSSGCIRLTCGDAYWIYKNCPKGTPIHVITGDGRDEELLEKLQPSPLINQRYDPTDPEAPAKYRYIPEVEPTPDPTPVPGVTPYPTPAWTVHPTLKAWGVY